MQSWALTSRIYAGDLVKTTCERPQGHVPGYPWLRWGQGQCQPGSHETHPVGENDAHSISQGEHQQSSNPQGLLSQGCAPIPPASTQIRITAHGECKNSPENDSPNTLIKVTNIMYHHNEAFLSKLTDTHFHLQSRDLKQMCGAEHFRRHSRNEGTKTLRFR